MKHDVGIVTAESVKFGKTTFVDRVGGEVMVLGRWEGMRRKPRMMVWSCYRQLCLCHPSSMNLDSNDDLEECS
jgi:hypothetical protein